MACVCVFRWLVSENLFGSKLQKAYKKNGTNRESFVNMLIQGILITLSVFPLNERNVDCFECIFACCTGKP